MKARINGFPMIVLTGILLLLCAPQANATIQLSLVNGSSSVLVLDGGSNDACPLVDCVAYIGSVGNYFLNITAGVAQNGTNPYLDLGSANNSTGVANAGLLTITTTANGFTAPAPQFNFQVGGTSSLGGASTFAAYGGNSNNLLDFSHQIGSTLTFPSSPFSASTLGGGATVSPYSLTIVASLNGLTAGTASFDAAIDAVPEPMSVSLLGGVLLLTATAIRRRLRRSE